MQLKIYLSYLELFYWTTYHRYEKYKVWDIFYFLFEFKHTEFFTSRGGYLLNTRLLDFQ